MKSSLKAKKAKTGSAAEAMAAMGSAAATGGMEAMAALGSASSSAAMGSAAATGRGRVRPVAPKIRKLPYIVAPVPKAAAAALPAPPQALPQAKKYKVEDLKECIGEHTFCFVYIKS